MRKTIFTLIFILSFLANAKDLTPDYTLEANGGVTDLILNNNI